MAAHFERLINVLHDKAPRTKLAFNSKPDDSDAAALRWLLRGNYLEVSRVLGKRSSRNRHADSPSKREGEFSHTQCNDPVGHCCPRDSGSHTRFRRRTWW